jgi:hypothetical protein
MVRELGLEREVERIAGFLVPEQVVVRERLGVLDRSLQVEAAVGVTASMRSRSAPSGAPPIFILTTE